MTTSPYRSCTQPGPTCELVPPDPLNPAASLPSGRDPLNSAIVDDPRSAAHRGWYASGPDEPAFAHPLDLERPGPARVYDCLMGVPGYAFVVDQRFASALLAAVPVARHIAWTNARFVAGTVRALVAAGTRQILDLGCGFPGMASIHHVLREHTPHLAEVAAGVRIVHVDIDPIAVHLTQEAKEAGGWADRSAAVHADIRQVHTITGHPEVGRLLDLDQPVAIFATALLHHLDGRQDDPAAVLADLHDATIPGTHLVVSHLAPGRPDDVVAIVTDCALVGIPLTPRTPDQMAQLLRGWQLVAPGLVWAPRWHPDPGRAGRGPAARCALVSAGGRGPLGRQPVAGNAPQPSQRHLTGRSHVG